MELLKYYDKTNERFLGVDTRDYIHDNNLWHREVAIWIINDKKEVLLQRRSKNKTYPNKLSITAGHVDKDEKEIDAALREIFEEIGLNITKEDLKFITIYKNLQDKNNCFSYNYLLKTNKKINDMTMQKEEVSELMYIQIDELLKRVLIGDDEIAFSRKLFINEVLEKIREYME